MMSQMLFNNRLAGNLSSEQSQQIISETVKRVKEQSLEQIKSSKTDSGEDAKHEANYKQAMEAIDVAVTQFNDPNSPGELGKAKSDGAQIASILDDQLNKDNELV